MHQPHIPYKNYGCYERRDKHSLIWDVGRDILKEVWLHIYIGHHNISKKRKKRKPVERKQQESVYFTKFRGKRSEYLLIDFPFSNFCLLVLETDAAFELLSSRRRGSTYKTSPFRCHPLVLSPVSPANPLATRSSDSPAPGILHEACSRQTFFSFLFHPIPFPVPSFHPPLSFSFSPFSETPSRRMSHLPFHIRLRLWYCGGVYVSPGFSTGMRKHYLDKQKVYYDVLKCSQEGTLECNFQMDGMPFEESIWKVSLAINELFASRYNSNKNFLFIKKWSVEHTVNARRMIVSVTGWRR